MHAKILVKLIVPARAGLANAIEQNAIEQNAIEQNAIE